MYLTFPPPIREEGGDVAVDVEGGSVAITAKGVDHANDVDAQHRTHDVPAVAGGELCCVDRE